jgi:leader peptidase (prepilin peptidase)/N-methyltransferase
MLIQALLFLKFLLSPTAIFAMSSGALIGSFLNVCIVRIPSGTFLAKSRSHCPSCDKVIPFYLNIPIFSFLFLRGRSRCCNTPISKRYLAVELLTAFIFLVLASNYPFLKWSEGVLIWSEPNLIRWSIGAALASILIACSFIDLKHYIIPDVISLPSILLAPVMAGLHPDLNLRDSLMGIGLGAGLLYVISWAYWLVRRQAGLGFGDVKLLALIGGWLGWQAIFPTVLIASVTGSIFGLALLISRRKLKLQTAIPFGPFLSLGAMLFFLRSEWIHEIFRF